MNTLKNENPSDPELEALLDLLRETPARNPRVVERGRAKYLSDLDQMFAQDKNSAVSWLDNLLTLRWLGQNRDKARMQRSTKLSYLILVTAFLMVVILFSGAGVTALAAQTALPGDALYGIKTTIEDTQVRLTANAATLAELHIKFAEHRLDEISGLIAVGRYGEIERLAQEFEFHVQQALSAMQIVAAGDPVRAQQLAARVNAALSEYARSLSGMMMNVPESARASMERAIITSQNAGNMAPAELEDENSNDALHDASSNSNSDDTGLNQFNQNGGFFNENENLNHNSDENTNLNTNEESNDIIENQNSRDDQNRTSNMNENENDNQNNSGDENDNDHHDSNDNDNEHNQNSNINDHDGNENGGDD